MKILIINPFGIGDVLFTTPVVRALKEKFPNSFIGYICNRSSAAVLVNNPDIDELFFYSRGDFKKIRRKSVWKYLIAFTKAIFKIRKLRFDIAVDLSMVMQYSLMLWLVGVPKRYGFDYMNRGRFLTDKIPVKGFANKHVVDYYFDLLKNMGIDNSKRSLKFYLSSDDKKWADDFLKAHNTSDNDLLVGIAPFGGLSWGSDAKNKQWPIDSFCSIARQIIEQYKVKVVLFGTEKDQAKAGAFDEFKGSDMFMNAVGKTTLGQLAAMIGKCKLFICNDSGPLHIACALDVKTVSIFGPVDENVYGPVGESRLHSIAHADIDCRPCYKNFQKPVCNTMDCLQSLSREKVLDIVEESIFTISSK